MQWSWCIRDRVSEKEVDEVPAKQNAGWVLKSESGHVVRKKARARKGRPGGKSGGGGITGARPETEE